jgi:hypothetical protein
MPDCGNTVPHVVALRGKLVLISNEIRAALLLRKTVQFSDKSVNHPSFASFGWSSYLKKAENALTDCWSKDNDEVDKNCYDAVVYRRARRADCAGCYPAIPG